GEYNRPLPLLFPNPDLTEPRTQNPIADGEVNYAGQIVAMIVAVDRYSAEDARERVVVEWEPLPVVIDLEEAASETSALVHDDMESNISGTIRQVVGDPDSVFEKAPIVLKKRYVLERSAAMPMETRGLVADVDPKDGSLTLWNATQVVHPLRSGLAGYFG